MIFYDYVIGSSLITLAAHHNSTSCYSLAMHVNGALSAWQKLIEPIVCNIVRFKVVLICVLFQICVNVRLLGMRVQNKRLYASWHVYLMKIAIRVLCVLK